MSSTVTYITTAINFKSKFYQYIFSIYNIDKSQAKDFLLNNISRMASLLKNSNHPDELLKEIELHKNELLKEYKYSFKGTKTELIYINVYDKYLIHDFQYITNLYNKYIGTLDENKRVEIIRLVVSYIDWTHKMAKTRIKKKIRKNNPSTLTIESEQKQNKIIVTNKPSLVFDNDYVKTVNLFSEFMFSNPDILAKFVEFMNNKK